MLDPSAMTARILPGAVEEARLFAAWLSKELRMFAEGMPLD